MSTEDGERSGLPKEHLPYNPDSDAIMVLEQNTKHIFCKNTKKTQINRHIIHFISFYNSNALVGSSSKTTQRD
ncbi:hypothetical protein GWI33_019279 [Rhynchophorus ferrugineus]|uniref:Uncharacterized protein n=1 Tax=Rhynchophorus ferrugineus TaxID=354439 RepID=A0A834HUR7_RHYFE|nr:hypothetical protein GWI33_019279 [Rhynchophorus ferrugineus]